MTADLRLAEALGRPVGRGTLLTGDAEAQLCPQRGTLTTQLARLHDEVGRHIHPLVGTRPDLPPRRPHPWTLLTEHEHAAWPLLALSHPPVLPAAHAVQVARHLATAHLAMDAARCATWAAGSHARDGYEPLRLSLPQGAQATWAGLAATVLTVQAGHAMLHGWGVLSAYVGLQPTWRPQAAAQVLAAIQHDPLLLSAPAELAATTLWATLSLLHGGLPRPPGPEVAALAQAMRTLPERTVTAPLPNPARLRAHLLGLLPHLTGAEFAALADPLYGRAPGDPQTTLGHTSGQQLSAAPGYTAYWLRRAGQVQVVTIVRPQAGAALDVRAWHWNL